jgi:hypothetical protein
MRVADTKRQWQYRARETRSMASHIADPESKRILLAIAGAYDRLAKLAEECKDKDKDKAASD